MAPTHDHYWSINFDYLQCLVLVLFVVNVVTLQKIKASTPLMSTEQPLEYTSETNLEAESQHQFMNLQTGQHKLHASIGV